MYGRGCTNRIVCEAINATMTEKACVCQLLSTGIQTSTLGNSCHINHSPLKCCVELSSLTVTLQANRGEIQGVVRLTPVTWHHLPTCLAGKAAENTTGCFSSGPALLKLAAPLLPFALEAKRYDWAPPRRILPQVPSLSSCTDSHVSPLIFHLPDYLSTLLRWWVTPQRRLILLAVIGLVKEGRFLSCDR